MSISNFDKVKELDITSVTGIPIISRVVPIKITSGDDSTTGTGEIVLDWTNISSKADIAVYDENDNLLDYHISNFNTTTEEAVIYIYKIWVRDGSIQAQIAYGNGPNDQSVSSSTVFDKETDLIAGYLLNETSGDALDATSNNFDATVIGAAQGVTGQVGKCYSYDGLDDYNENTGVGSYLNGMLDVSFCFWAKSNSIGNDRPIFSCNTTSFGNENDDFILVRFDENGWLGNGTEVLKVGIKTDTGISNGESESYATSTDWMFLVFTWSSGNAPILYKDGQALSWTNPPSSLSGTLIADTLAVGRGSKDEWFDGLIDHFLTYNSSLTINDAKAKYDASKAIPDFFNQQKGESTQSDETLSMQFFQFPF